MKRLIISILAALALSGCQFSTAKTGPSTSAPSPQNPAETTKKESGHEHSTPHGGALLELGEEFARLEFVLDATTGRLTAYALDGKAEKAVRVKQSSIEITIFNPAAVVKLYGVANSLTGESANDTSEFAGESDALKGASSFDGMIRAVTIRGRQFKGVTFSFPDGNEK
jgi:Flp pilus assembly protein TadD